MLLPQNKRATHLVFLFLPFIGKQSIAQTTNLYGQTSEVNNIMVRYRADYGNLSRFYTVRNGVNLRAGRKQKVFTGTPQCGNRATEILVRQARDSNAER